MEEEAAAKGEDRTRTRRAHRHEDHLAALVARLRADARAQEHELETLRDQLANAEVELDDLRAVRDALAPAELPSRPGMDVAASFMPAAAHVSGDFYLVAEGPHDSSVLVVGDVVGKGLAAARRAAFVRTVFATTAPYSDDPARLLGWANVALLEHATDDREFVTVACAVFSPRERLVRWAYAGHPAMLWLDSGDELQGGRTMPLALSADAAFTTATAGFTPRTGVLLYTDGVTEARRNGEQFGPTRLRNTVRAPDPPSSTTPRLSARLHPVAVARRLRDAVTNRQPRSAGAPRPQRTAASPAASA
ncbi:MAG TPA: PP2C family protein-serine/threonine phosphatase, partial [Thermoleophilaceae bacterium]|nr:PP2C family protein-serine/threonine phosphatase [Thermoleophilaceae bacterium]